MTNLQSTKAQTEDIRTEVAKDLFTHVEGEFAAELLGPQFTGIGKKATRKYLDQQLKQQRQMLVSSYEGQFEYRLSQIKEFLSTVSIKKRNLTREGNSHLILQRFASLNNYTNLETRIKKAITIVENISHESLIFNKDIPEPQVESKDAYEILKNLETALRKFIESSLGYISNNWWKERISADVRYRAEERKQKNEQMWPWYTEKELHPVYYIDFTDYAKIIRRKDNWRDIFSEIFKDEELIVAKLKELEPIRNAIAHSRDLTHNEVERLRLNSQDVINSIRTSR